MVRRIIFCIIVACIPSLYAMEEVKDPHTALIHFAKYDDDNIYSGRGMFMSDEALRQINNIDECCDCGGCVAGTGCIAIGAGMSIAACTTCSPLLILTGSILSLPWWYGGARHSWRTIAEFLALSQEKKEILRVMCGTPLRMSDVHQKLLQNNAKIKGEKVKVILQKAYNHEGCDC